MCTPFISVSTSRFDEDVAVVRIEAGAEEQLPIFRRIGA
jgi:hypothetical protein